MSRATFWREARSGTSEFIRTIRRISQTPAPLENSAERLTHSPQGFRCQTVKGVQTSVRKRDELDRKSSVQAGKRGRLPYREWPVSGPCAARTAMVSAHQGPLSHFSCHHSLPTRIYGITRFLFRAIRRLLGHLSSTTCHSLVRAEDGSWGNPRTACSRDR